MREIKQLIVHAADTYPDMDIGAAEIRQWHLQRGWSDIGYNYVIRRNGKVEPGRDRDGDGNVDEEVGAHAMGMNANSIGICMIGGKSRETDGADANFTYAQYNSLYALLQTLLAKYPGAEVMGHRDVPNAHKPCPCFDVKSFVGK